jgi:hypothetical protein
MLNYETGRIAFSPPNPKAWFETDASTFTGFSRKEKDIKRPHFYQFSLDCDGRPTMSYKNLSRDETWWNIEEEGRIHLLKQTPEGKPRLHEDVAFITSLAAKRWAVFETYKYDSCKFTNAKMKSEHFSEEDKSYMTDLFNKFSTPEHYEIDPADAERKIHTVMPEPLLDELRAKYTWQELPKFDYESEAAYALRMKEEATHNRPSLRPIVHSGYTDKARKKDAEMYKQLEKEAEEAIKQKETSKAEHAIVDILNHDSPGASRAPTEVLGRHAQVYAHEKVAREELAVNAPKQSRQETVVTVGRARPAADQFWTLLHWQENWENHQHERTWEESEGNLAGSMITWNELDGEKVLVWWKLQGENTCKPWLGEVGAHENGGEHVKWVSYADGDSDIIDFNSLEVRGYKKKVIRPAWVLLDHYNEAVRADLEHRTGIKVLPFSTESAALGGEAPNHTGGSVTASKRKRVEPNRYVKDVSAGANDTRRRQAERAQLQVASGIAQEAALPDASGKRKATACKCGSVTHARTTHKDCLLHRNIKRTRTQ